MARPKNRKQRQNARQPPIPAEVIPIEDCLDGARESLDAVRHAWEDFSTAYGAKDEKRLKTAVRNFVEQGRSVTWALQHLKSHLGDEWEPWWAETRRPLDDPVSQYFYKLRNPMVKEGRVPKLGGTTHYKHLVIEADCPGENESVEFYLGPHGPVFTHISPRSTVKMNARRLGDIVSWMTLGNIPEEFAGHPLSLVMQRHLCRLESVVIAAHAKFGLQDASVDPG